MAGYFVSKGVDKFGFGFNFLHKEVQIFQNFSALTGTFYISLVHVTLWFT